MELQNIRNVIKKNSNYCTDIMTPWERVSTNINESNEHYDYIPIVKNGIVSSLYVDEDKKKYNMDSGYFIDEKADLISVLDRLNQLYNNGKFTFMVIGNTNKPIGILNHNDLNKLSFIHVMWDIFYNFEIKLANCLEDKYSYDEKIKSLELMDRLGKNSYNHDKNNNQDLDPIFYFNLSNKIKLYNKLPVTNIIKVDAKFRNNMAHPKTKARIIYKKSEIPLLFKNLEEIDKFLP